MTDKNKEPRKKIEVLEEDRELMADFQKKIKKGLTNKNKDCIVFLSNQYENRESKNPIKNTIPTLIRLACNEFLKTVILFLFSLTAVQKLPI